MGASIIETVEPALLEWAEHNGSKDAVALRKKFTHWDAWVSGHSAPSLAQVHKISDFTNIPFGMLMLSQPPQVELPVRDFRSGRNSQTCPDSPPASRDLLDVIMQMQRRQNWYEDYLGSVGADVPLDFVESSRGATYMAAAASIRSRLEYEVKDRIEFKAKTDARSYLMRTFEQAGGLVVITSMVGNSTSRILNNREFRGFTLHSNLAPLVFVNSAHESVNAQVFSLLHEFAHVWRGESGISAGGNEDYQNQDPHLMNPPPNPQANREIEQWCDLVAGEVAVPADDLRQRFDAGCHDFTEELERLSSTYWCSTLVVLLRLRQTGLVPWEGFAQTYAAEVERLQELAAQNDASGGRADFYRNQRFRIGETLSRAVIRDLKRGRTSPTQALRLLGFSSMSMIDKYASGDYLGES